MEVKNTISFRALFALFAQNKQLFIPRRKYLHMVFQATSNAGAEWKKNEYVHDGVVDVSREVWQSSK